jgi:prepilin-type N-terminal cleavage/methylation domain-containing protein
MARTESPGDWTESSEEAEMKTNYLKAWSRRCLRRGVTLVEVLIVVAIIAMVAGGVAVFALPKFRVAQSRRRRPARA